MFHALNSAFGDAAIERLTLLVNHVLASEPAATKKLAVHVGRSVRLQFTGWPPMLPPLPIAAFRVTPAGLLEWCGGEPPFEADLRVDIDASNPALALFQSITGSRPKVDISGDAAFAADLNWLIDNVRWDMQDDLARVIGEAPAHELSKLASQVASGLREAVRGLGSLAARANGAPAEPPVQ